MPCGGFGLVCGGESIGDGLLLLPVEFRDCGVGVALVGEDAAAPVLQDRLHKPSPVGFFGWGGGLLLLRILLQQRSHEVHILGRWDWHVSVVLQIQDWYSDGCWT